MAIFLYRGDTRPPDPVIPNDPDPKNSIRAAGGFSARVPLTPAIARDLVNRCMNQAGPYAPVALPPLASKALRDAVNSNDKINLVALMADIKKGKQNDSVHISTDVSPAAGGYPTSYVYRMTFTLNYQHLQRNVLGPVQPVGNNSNVLASAVSTNLVFEGASMAVSQFIALTGVGAVGLTEVAFLTSIPYADITHYQAPGTGVWVPMP